MANTDSKVEVQVVGKLDGSVAATSAAAKAQIASISQASQQLGSTLQQEASAWQAQRSAASAGGAALEDAGKAAAGTHGSISTATREFRALFDELSSGRTRQTPGTLAIIGQRVFGLGPVALLATGAIAGLAAGLGYLVVKSIEAANALERAKAAADFSGNEGLGTKQLKASTDALDQFAGVTSKDAQEVINSFARMRDMSAPELDALSRLVGEYAETQGVKAPEAAKIFIAALNNEKLTAGELVKLLPGITQAEIDNVEATQRMGNAHQTAAALLATMSTALDRVRRDYAEQNTGIMSSFKSYMAYVGGLASGMTVEEIHNDLLKHNTDAWDNNSKAILSDLEALKKLAAQPPPTDLQDPIEKARDALARLDANWKGSTSGRYMAEAQLWEKVAQGNDLNAKQRAEAQRNADEAIFHSHEALKTESLKLMGEENQEAKREQEFRKEIERGILSDFHEMQQEQVADSNASATEQISDIRELFQQKQVTAAQEVTMMRDVENERYRSTVMTLMSLRGMYAGYAAETAQVNKEIEANERSHQKTMDQIAREGSKDMAREYQETWQPMLNGFRSVVSGVLSGNETLVQALGRGAMRVAEEWIDQQLRQLFVTEATEQSKTAATVAGNTERTAANAAAASADQGLSLAAMGSQIIADAKLAAANTYAAVSAIPYVGPFLAPEAAAAAFAAVAAFDTITSFDVGTPNVPRDMLAQIHQGEIIVPQDMSSAIRSGDLTLGGGGQSDGSGGGGGDTHLHIGDVYVQGVATTDPGAFGRKVVDAIARQVRQGNPQLKNALHPA